VTALMSSVSTLLAGVYYPIEVLPWWLQGMAKVFPLTHAVQSFRSALLEGASPAALYRSMFVLLLFGIVLGPPSMFAFSWAVLWSKRAGTLGQF
jgi:ABC-2 type transport system permease protein